LAGKSEDAGREINRESNLTSKVNIANIGKQLDNATNTIKQLTDTVTAKEFLLQNKVERLKQLIATQDLIVSTTRKVVQNSYKAI